MASLSWDSKQKSNAFSDFPHQRRGLGIPRRWYGKQHLKGLEAHRMQLEGGAWQTTNTENLLSEPDMGPWKSKQVQQQQRQLHSLAF